MNIKWVFIRNFAGIMIVSLPFVLQSQDLKLNSPQEYQTFKPQQDRGSTNYIALQGLIYIPPSLDKKAPKKGNRREKRLPSGGTRGKSFSAPLQLTLLSPTHVAQTTRSKPSLYWHISRGTQLPAILTIIEVNGIKPLVEVQLQEPLTKGLHVIQLNDYGIELQLDKIYEWSISLIKDKENQHPSSDDIVEKAFVERISNPIMGVENMDQKNKTERARIFAVNRIWYESLEALMGSDPYAIKNSEILELRTELLEQVGLTDLK